MHLNWLCEIFPIMTTVNVSTNSPKILDLTKRGIFHYITIIINILLLSLLLPLLLLLSVKYW